MTQQQLRPAASWHPVARPLHPMAWWGWALGLAVAASSTTNPLLLLLIIAVAGYVVAARRTDAPWARAFRAYLLLGLSIIVIRVVFTALLGVGSEGPVLLTLPSIPLPEWAAGLELGGQVTWEDVLAAGYEGLRLAALICCVGAANALANPKRALRSMPAALYEVGVAVVVAISVAPQLFESAQRVRRARRLRGGRTTGLRAIKGIVLPVLTDALERSLALAAAMDSRGYGHTGPVSRRDQRLTGGLLLAGLAGIALGIYVLLDQSRADARWYDPQWTVPLLVGGALAAGGLWASGRRVRRTVYDADSWAVPEALVLISGCAAAACLTVIAHLDPLALVPPLSPLGWPSLPALPAAAVLLALLPAVAAPPTQRGEAG